MSSGCDGCGKRIADTEEHGLCPLCMVKVCLFTRSRLEAYGGGYQPEYDAAKRQALVEIRGSRLTIGAWVDNGARTW